MIEGDLANYSALELVALGVVSAHIDKQGTAKTVKHPIEQRLKKAIRALKGKSSKLGQVPKFDAERVCT
jgi:hypothetical protein